MSTILHAIIIIEYITCILEKEIQKSIKIKKKTKYTNKYILNFHTTHNDHKSQLQRILSKINFKIITMFRIRFMFML